MADITELAPDTHAKLSPSGASRWTTCRGSVALGIALNIKDRPSEAAAEGTVGHDIAAKALRFQLMKGRVYDYDQHLDTVVRCDGFDIRVRADLLEAVKGYVDNIMQLHEDGAQVFVEVKLPLEGITGEENATGTGDAVAIIGNELHVEDLKLGRGVLVDVEDNKQLLMYALAAYDVFAMAGEIDKVTMVINQPRAGGRKAITFPVDQLLESRELFTLNAKKAMKLIDYARVSHVSDIGVNVDERIINELNPSEDACRFCKNKPWCPALNILALEAERAVYVNVSNRPEDLASAYSRAVVLKHWVSAVEEETKRQLEDGKHVPGYGLVNGRAGARAWTEPEKVESLLKSLDIPREDIYDSDIKSPTQMEKVLKKNKVIWAQLQDHIIRRPPSQKIASTNASEAELTGFRDLDE